LDADLNHLDIIDLVVMSGAFKESSFNGDISEWKTPNLRLLFLHEYVLWAILKAKLQKGLQDFE